MKERLECLLTADLVDCLLGTRRCPPKGFSTSRWFDLGIAECPPVSNAPPVSGRTASLGFRVSSCWGGTWSSVSDSVFRLPGSEGSAPNWQSVFIADGVLKAGMSEGSLMRLLPKATSTTSDLLDPRTSCPSARPCVANTSTSGGTFGSDGVFLDCAPGGTGKEPEMRRLFVGLCCGGLGAERRLRANLSRNWAFSTCSLLIMSIASL
mmetsp:Transcript_102571/g.316529  ORF Transcript_102571/g.316529 Transcript_102571/m.316529 type:complete len:208 (+) Transcript_102571:1116-1739(+)